MSVRFGSAVVAASLLLAACSSSGGHTTAPTTTVVTANGEHASQAAARAAILPLADLPAGTTAQPPGKPSDVSCTGTSLVTKPRYVAWAIYQLPRSSTRLGDGAQIFAPGGAAQIMRDVREQWNCPVATLLGYPNRRWSVAKLTFPSIAPGQLSYEFRRSYSSRPKVTTSIADDVGLLPVNSSSVLELSDYVTSTNGSAVVDLSAFQEFVRKAWTRAESALGR
jgi:hypothetical protein